MIWILGTLLVIAVAIIAALVITLGDLMEALTGGFFK